MQKMNYLRRSNIKDTVQVCINQQGRNGTFVRLPKRWYAVRVSEIIVMSKFRVKIKRACNHQEPRLTEHVDKLVKELDTTITSDTEVQKRYIRDKDNRNNWKWRIVAIKDKPYENRFQSVFVSVTPPTEEIFLNSMLIRIQKPKLA